VVGYSSCVIGYIVLSVSVDAFELMAEISCYVLVTAVVGVGVYRVCVVLSSRSSLCHV
jgi:NADH:ubiquinone oxidoreductase subunit 2 (subunit N)